MCLLCLLFVWKYLQETKGKSLEQIERDFAGHGPRDAKAEPAPAIVLSEG
jgi:hypothetical protein